MSETLVTAIALYLALTGLAWFGVATAALYDFGVAKGWWHA